jgi:hypothetical protein
MPKLPWAKIFYLLQRVAEFVKLLVAQMAKYLHEFRNSVNYAIFFRFIL